MAIATATDLLQVLRDNQMLPAQQLREAETLADKCRDAKALARELLQRNFLTAYQVNQLLQDRKTELLLGDNILIERLGAGGMGTVYKARQKRLDRVAVIKTIRKEHLANANAVQRFEQEARAAARLSHPNIVSVYDAGEANGTHFLAMEFIEGTDLAKLVKERGPLPIASACECIRQAALGLQHAHEQGLVHRDIKPHNLLLNPAKGQVKILDMGLARLNSDPDATAAGLTASGTIVGTVDYMTPEQAEDSRHADVRADIYSLGCTLYFLLSGKVPFPGGEPLGKLLRHRTEEPTPVEKLRPEVPVEVVAVVRKMMAKDVTQRYQTPVEVVKVLAPLVAQFRRAKSASSAAVATAGGKLSPMGSAPPAGTDTPPEEVPEEELSHTISEELLARRETRLDGRKIGGVVVAAVGRVSRQGAGLWWRGVTQGSGKRRIAVAVATVLVPLLLWAMLPGGRKPAPTLEPKTDEKVPEVPGNTFTNSIGMEFVLVPKGKALLGGGGGQVSSKEVDVGYDFYMGKYEVTQEEWEKVTGLTPSQFSRAGGGKNEVANIATADLKRFPVENVSWAEAQTFIARLNDKEKEAGWVYRLPTEVEWEYACRGGPMKDNLDSAFDYYFTKPANLLVPNYNHGDKSLKRPCKVGTYKPNRLGLYDMHGNVYEWCQDEIPGDPKDPKAASRRVVRGGGWSHDSSSCRATGRELGAPSDRDSHLGLRLVHVPLAK